MFWFVGHAVCRWNSVQTLISILRCKPSSHPSDRLRMRWRPWGIVNRNSFPCFCSMWYMLMRVKANDPAVTSSLDTWTCNGSWMYAVAQHTFHTPENRHNEDVSYTLFPDEKDDFLPKNNDLWWKFESDSQERRGSRLWHEKHVINEDETRRGWERLAADALWKKRKKKEMSIRVLQPFGKWCGCL